MAKPLGGRLVDAIPQLHRAVRELATADPPVPPIVTAMLRAVLAQWLVAFYRENRWRLQGRADTTGVRPPGDAEPEGFEDKFTEWGAERLQREIGRIFHRALSGDTLTSARLIDHYPLLQGFEGFHPVADGGGTEKGE